MNGRLTLDYGVRLVHQQPQYDELGQASNFLPDRVGRRPGAAAVRGRLRRTASVRARAPTARRGTRVTGQLLGAEHAAAIGTLVPNTGNTTNGLFLSGQGIAETTYTWPALALAPRFGTGLRRHRHSRSSSLRGGAGLFYDRPSGNSIYPQVQNPPTIRNVTVRYAQLQDRSARGLHDRRRARRCRCSNTTADCRRPSQWNSGVQMTLPWASALDVEYVGQHSYNTLDGGQHQRDRFRRGVPARRTRIRRSRAESDAGRRRGDQPI